MRAYLVLVVALITLTSVEARRGGGGGRGGGFGGSRGSGSRGGGSRGRGAYGTSSYRPRANVLYRPQYGRYTGRSSFSRGGFGMGKKIAYFLVLALDVLTYLFSINDHIKSS